MILALAMVVGWFDSTRENFVSYSWWDAHK